MGEGGYDARANLLTLLLVAAAPPLHGSGALRAEPLPFGGLGQTHTAVVEPLNGTLQQGDDNTLVSTVYRPYTVARTHKVCQNF